MFLVEEHWWRFVGVHQWHVSAGPSQLWLTAWPAVVGRATVLMKGTMWSHGERRVQDGEKREQFIPLSSQTNTADSRCQAGPPPQPIRLQHLFVCQLTGQTPMYAPLMGVHDAEGPLLHPTPQRGDGPSTHLLSSPFDIIVACSTVMSVLLALLSTGL